MIKIIHIKIFIINIFSIRLENKQREQMYLTVAKVVKDLKKEGGNSYTYTKVSNLLSGFKGNATIREIQQLRKLIEKDFSTTIADLKKMEK